MWCNYVKWICFCCSFLPYNVVFFNKAIFSYDQKRLLCYNSNSNDWEKHQKRFSFPISVSFSEWAKLLTSQRSFAYFVLPLFVPVFYSGANQCPVCRGCAGDITRFIHPNVSDACKASLLSSSLFLPCFVVPQHFPTWLRNPLESTPVPWSCNGVHPLELEMHCYTHFTAVWDALLHASSEALAPLLMRRQLKKENASNWKSPHQKCLSASTRATPARDRCSGGLLSWRQVHYLKSLGSLKEKYALSNSCNNM